MNDTGRGLESDPAMQEEHDFHNEGGHAESWQEEQPPVDDFSDPAVAEGEIVEEMPVAQAATPNKKKGTMVMVAVLVLGAAGIGGLAYTQMGGGDNFALPIASTPDSNMAMAPLPVPTPEVPTAPAPTMPGEVVSTPTAPQADMPVPVVSDTNSAAALPNGAEPVPMAPEPVPAPTAELPVPAPVMPEVMPVPAQNAAAPSMPTVVAPAPATTELSATTATPSVSALPEVEAKLTALTTQVEALRAMMEQTAQQTTQLSNRLDVVAAAAPTKAVAENNVAMSDEMSAAPVVKKAKKSASRSAKKAKKAVATRAQKSSGKATATVASAAKGQWVIRSAMPSEAWLAKSADAVEMLRVKPGDNLPGLGKVLSIEQWGNDWVVVGKEGVVR